MHTNSINRHFAALAADPSTTLGRMFGTGPRLPEPEGGGEGGNTPEGGGKEGEDDGADDGGGHDRHLQSAIAERDKAKSKLRETQAQLAEYQERDRKAAEARDREAGDWSKLEARYQQRLEAETARADGLQAQLDKMQGGQRRSAFAKAIATKAGTSADAVERLLPTLGLPDDAPESFNNIDVTGAAKALREQVPDLFKAGSSDPKPPPSGGDPPEDKNNPDYWRNLAAKRSRGGRNAAYDHATGRGPK